MSVSISKIITALLLIPALVCTGQEKTVAEKKDTVISFRPTGIRLGADMVGVIKTGITPGFSNQEIFADIDFHRYYLVAEAGRSSHELTISNGTYTNKGTYLRLGADVNFLVKDPDKNMFFLGFRYGRAIYDEQVTYLTESEFGDREKIAANSGVSSGWLELTTGLRIKVWKAFWMGYTGRIKFSPSTPEESPVAPYDIPGYGLTFKQPWWGFSYYLMFRIPLKKNS